MKWESASHGAKIGARGVRHVYRAATVWISIAGNRSQQGLLSTKEAVSCLFVLRPAHVVPLWMEELTQNRKSEDSWTDKTS